MDVLLVFTPVVLGMVLGFFCKKRQIVTSEGLAGINALITKILLPAVLFRAMATISYSADNLLLFFVMLIAMILMYGLGFLSKRFMGEYQTYTPWLISVVENGMLGFALFSLLAGSENLKYIAAVDMGNTVFANSVYLGTLVAVSNGVFSMKKTVKLMFTAPAFLGTIIGILFGITGWYEQLYATNVGLLIDELLQFVSEPLTFLVLFAVGYKFDVFKGLMAPVLKTIGIRLVAMVILFVACRFVVFSFMEYNKLLDAALTLTFALPASLVVPVFTKKDKDNAYASTTLSLYMIITLIVYVILAATL